MRRIAFGLVVVSAIGSAHAQQAAPVPPPAVAAAAITPAAPVPATALDAAVLARIGAITAKATTEEDRAWAARLAEFYGERNGRPVWLAAGGFSTAATTLMEEIGRADDFGLSPKAFALPRTDDAAPAGGDSGRANAEVRLSLAAIKYVEHARGGRLDPLALSRWLDQAPKPVDPKATLAALAEAVDPAAHLRSLHPRHPQFEALREAYVKLRAPAAKVAEAKLVRIPDGPRLKPGDRHPDIALIRQRLEVPAGEFERDLYDDRLETALKAYLKAGGFKTASVVTREVRSALNQPARKVVAAGIDARKLLVNMERWRWLPDDLGDLHIWNNLPEYETRVVKLGRTIHQERIIIGKPESQTPVFSDRMRFVVFQPEWGVPNSIKVKSLLPKLQDGNFDVLEQRNMRISVNGRTIDPDTYDWDKIDIRRVPIVQDAGPENPLGQMKFMFPNKHDVYMHDTPAKGLFTSSSRSFSHGCIRVRNPRKLAEIVLAETTGWTPDQIAAQLTKSAKPNNRIDLGRQVPVHNTYFTVLADETGTLRAFGDVYGHDRRIGAVLIDGKSAAAIAEQDPARKLEREIEEIVASNTTAKPKKPEVKVAATRRPMASPSYLGALFGN